MANQEVEHKSFPTPPLIEVIAELRWGSDQIAASTISGSETNKIEELFMQFGSKIASQGYDRFERIIPAGFPLIPFQPVYRYRTKNDFSLYQLGNGIFSANIIPPYDSWHQFRPIIENGVDLLLEFGNGECKKLSNASLRYINAFKTNLTEGKSFSKFLNDTLGISIKLPPILINQVESEEKIIPMLRLTIPLNSNQQMSLNLAEGFVSNEKVVIMDITVTTEHELPKEKKSIMDALDLAHKTIHDVFMDMTSPLHHLMS